MSGRAGTRGRSRSERSWPSAAWPPAAVLAAACLAGLSNPGQAQEAANATRLPEAAEARPALEAPTHTYDSPTGVLNALRRAAASDDEAERFRTASYFMLDCGSGITQERLAEPTEDPAQEGRAPSTGGSFQ